MEAKTTNERPYDGTPRERIAELITDLKENSEYLCKLSESTENENAYDYMTYAEGYLKKAIGYLQLIMEFKD